MVEKDIYAIQAKMNDKGQLGFGVFVDGNHVDCVEINALTEEQLQDIFYLLNRVTANIYHSLFFKMHGECPVCEVKSVFAEETDESN
jgi:hypothetical protein